MKPLTVHIEFASWVHGLVTEHSPLKESLQLPAAACVRDALNALSEKYPKLADILWDSATPSTIGPHIEIVVNGAILGLTHQLDGPLQANDTILLTAAYTGG